MRIEQPMAVAIIGALSTIPYEMLSSVLKLLGYAKYSVYELSSLMITLNRPNKILGAFLSMIIGASIAVILYYAIIGRFGWNNIIFKSIFINLQSWLVLEGLFMWLIEGRNFIPLRPISDYYSHLFSVTIFGIILGLLFQKYLNTK
ncbi:MAG TPA: hypothetical protein VIL66_07665 [Bacillota bacterium]